MSKRIYTRTGDAGTTGLHGGMRVPKDDIRIEANGTLDELNCHLGLIRSIMPDVPTVMPDPIGHLSGSGLPSGGTERASGEFRLAGLSVAGTSFDEILREVQVNLMTVMSQVATPSADREKNPNVLPDDLIPAIEAQIDALTEEAGDSLHFLLPGGTPLAAELQLARAVCRRAERRLWTLHRQDPLPEAILQYINRLSDLLFVMARCALVQQNLPEERWKAFTYKNKK